MERVHPAPAAAARLAEDMAGDDSQQHLRDDKVLSTFDKSQWVAVACMRMRRNTCMLLCLWQQQCCELAAWQEMTATSKHHVNVEIWSYCDR